MRAAWQCFFRALVRVFRRCLTQGQAVAFNMFLAFFPMLLLVLGVLNQSVRFQDVVREMLAGVRSVLPRSSQQVVMDFLGAHATHPWRWTLLGLVGTLLAGAHVMKLMMDGFQMAHGDPERGGFWNRQVRAMLLLCATLVPWLATVALTVLGKQFRTWLIHRYGLPSVFRWLGGAVFLSLVLAMAVLVLAVVYRLGRRAVRGWREVLPGAAVATILWWGANSAFGFYVRRMKYDVVYGGMAAAIGLLVWMQLTAMIVFFGAAFNAEVLAQGSGDAGPARLSPAAPLALGADTSVPEE